MRVYRTRMGGAVYWVAASGFADAMETLLKCWRDEGSTDDVEGSLVLQEMPSKSWPRYYDDSEGSGDPHASFAEMVANQTESSVLTCSEWP